MPQMSNQTEMPKFELRNIQVRKAFLNCLSENECLKGYDKKANHQIDLLWSQISLIQKMLEQYEIQAGKLTDATKAKNQQTSSDQEKSSTLDLEMNCLKEQLQQRDSEILIVKQRMDSLSAELAQIYKHENPNFVCTIPQSTLNDPIWVRSTFLNSLSENECLKENAKTARYQIDELLAMISPMRTELEQYEIQAGELNNATKEKHQQTCSDEEKTSTFDFEMNCLKEQLQQKDSEILTLKQKMDSLSAQLAQIYKHENPNFVCTIPQSTLNDPIWVREFRKVLLSVNQCLKEDAKTGKHQIDELLAIISQMRNEFEQYVIQELINAIKKKHQQTCSDQEKKHKVKKEMEKKIEKQAKELAEAMVKIVALEKRLQLEGKLWINNVVQLVVLQAIEKVSSKYKIFTERLTPNCISDRLIEKIWPEIELKHLELSPKRLKNVHKVTVKDLCRTHNCKEKDLIFNLREELDNITVPTFTRQLLALPRRVLSVYENREEYEDVVKNVTKDLVMHAMSEENDTKTWNPETSEFIIERLSQRIWDKILSKNYKISLEDIDQLSLKIFSELSDRCSSPIFFMRSGSPVFDEEVVKAFRKHAKLRS